jgi:hypothetical protein
MGWRAISGWALFPSAHNRRDPYALPAFEINGQWVYPSRYNTYLSPQLPVYVLEDEYLVSTGHGLEAPGLPCSRSTACACRSFRNSAVFLRPDGASRHGM